MSIPTSPNKAPSDLAVNGPLIKELRIRADLSSRSLAAAIGVSTTTLTTIELQGRLEGSKTVTVLVRLAQQLGVPVSDLLAVPTSPQPHVTATDISDDERVLAAILVGRTTPINKASVSASTRWTTARLNAVKRNLDASLRLVGLTVHESNQKMSIRPATGPLTAAHDLAQAATRNNKGLETEEARLMFRAATGRLRGSLGRSEVAARHLVNMGYLEDSSDKGAPGYTLTKAVASTHDRIRAIAEATQTSNDR